MRRLIFPSLASLAFLLAACATGPSSEQAPTPAAYAAFLTYPDRLQPVPGDSGAYRWIAPNANLARLMAWLLSDWAGWITGQVWAMDGGFSSVRPLVK